jgi:hypothetical protein
MSLAVLRTCSFTSIGRANAGRSCPHDDEAGRSGRARQGWRSRKEDLLARRSLAGFPETAQQNVDEGHAERKSRPASAERPWRASAPAWLSTTPAPHHVDRVSGNPPGIRRRAMRCTVSAAEEDPHLGRAVGLADHGVAAE